MRRLRLPLAAQALLLVGFGSRPAAGYEPPEVYVEGLVASWEGGEPSRRDALGFALSVSFTRTPSVFLRVVGGHPAVLAEWLAGIRRHTLGRREPSEPGRGPRAFRLVHETAQRWNGRRDRDLVHEILEATKPAPASSGASGPS